MTIKIVKNSKLIYDTVLGVSTDVIYSKDSPYYNKDVWILECKESKINVLPELLSQSVWNALSKAFLNESLINKRFCFTVIKKGKYLIEYKEIIGEK